MLTLLGHQPTGKLDSRLVHHRQFVLCVHDTCHMIHGCSSAWLKTVNKYPSSRHKCVCVCVCLCQVISNGCLGASEARCSGCLRLFQMEARQKEGLHLSGLNILRVDTSRAFACCQHWVIISPPVSKNPLSRAAAPKSVSGHSGNSLADHFR